MKADQAREDVGVDEKRTKGIQGTEKTFEKTFQNHLTNSKRCGIINKLSERRAAKNSKRSKDSDCILKTEQCLKGKKKQL